MEPCCSNTSFLAFNMNGNIPQNCGSPSGLLIYCSTKYDNFLYTIPQVSSHKNCPIASHLHFVTEQHEPYKPKVQEEHTQIVGFLSIKHQLVSPTQDYTNINLLTAQDLDQIPPKRILLYQSPIKFLTISHNVPEDRQLFL